MPKIAAMAFVVAFALAGAQGGCAPHNAGVPGQRSYWLRVETLSYGKPASLHVNITTTISGDCYPLGPTVIDVTVVKAWTHTVNIAPSCKSPTHVEVKASRHPANVGDGVQCLIEPVGRDSDPPIVADGARRDVPGARDIIVVDCSATLPGF